VLTRLQRVGHVLKEAPGLDPGGGGETAALLLPVPSRLGLPAYTPRPTIVALRGHRLVCPTGAGANIREWFGGSADQEGRKVLHTNSLRVEEFTLIARKISARAARLAEPPLHRRAPPVHLGGAPRPPVCLGAAGAVVRALGVPLALVDKGENAVLMMLIIVMIVLNGFTFYIRDPKHQSRQPVFPYSPAQAMETDSRTARLAQRPVHCVSHQSAVQPGGAPGPAQGLRAAGAVRGALAVDLALVAEGEHTVLMVHIDVTVMGCCLTCCVMKNGTVFTT